jgi:hypothetical protein
MFTIAHKMALNRSIDTEVQHHSVIALTSVCECVSFLHKEVQNSSVTYHFGDERRRERKDVMPALGARMM